MKLHAITHGPRPNRWCGPSALSIITGKTTDDLASDIRKLTGKRQVTGTSFEAMVGVLSKHGYTCEQVYYAKRGEGCTLAAWLRDTPRPAGLVYLVCAGWHWQVVSGRRYACGIVGRNKPVSIKDKRIKRRARVAVAYRLARSSA